MRATIWWACAIAALGCKGKAEPPATVTAPPPPTSAGSAGSAAASPHVAKPATPEQLAAYKQHMKAGWALQKQLKWAESVPEFEAALAAIELDQRAESELGWSAMNAGDFAKARKADDAAVKVAIDPKVKASALYNLGMVQAKTDDKDGARRSFEASLALRPATKAVEAELAKLGGKPAVDAPLCAGSADPCTCVTHDAFGDSDGSSPPSCEVSTDPRLPEKFSLYAIADGPWTYQYLLDEHHELVAVTGRSVDRTRIYEDMNLDKVETSQVAGHTVLRVQTADRVTETTPRDDDSMSVDEATIAAVTLCVVGTATTPTRCPLRDVPVSLSHHRYTLAPGAQKAGNSTDTTVDIALGDDGIATVKLVSGPSDPRIDAAVGPHKLW